MAKPSQLELPTPSEMVAWLDRHVCGQARAKWDLAVAVYAHYAGKALACDPAPGGGSGVGGPGRQHVLMIGPTGVGKTLLLRALARLLDVPVVFASATSLVETGYVGEPVEGLLRRLWAAAGEKLERAERGIVFLDEIDKIRRAADLSRDVSGEGVQNGLLTLLDGRAVPLRRDAPGQSIDSGQVLFVGAGAFVGLERIVASRAGSFQPMGFGAPRSEQATPALTEALASEDLVRFGLIPELLGRFATLAVLEPLGRDDLVAVLERAEGSALVHQRALYRLHGVELEVERPALDVLAERALRAGLGARGLARGLLACLRATTARLPELAESGVTHVIVDARGLLEAAEPRLVRGEGREAAERVRRLRRSALGGTPDGPQARLRQLEDGPLRVEQASQAVQSWWRELQRHLRLGGRDKLAVAEELGRRGSSISQLHFACQRSGTRDIAANLHFLDYVRRLQSRGETGIVGPQRPPGQGDLF